MVPPALRCQGRFTGGRVSVLRSPRVYLTPCSEGHVCAEPVGGGPYPALGDRARLKAVFTSCFVNASGWQGADW